MSTQWNTFRDASTRRRRLPGSFIAALVVLALLVIGGLAVVAYRSTERDVSFTVTDKERVCDTNHSDGEGGKQECRYLVFTDEGTYQVTDSLVIGRFSSSDVYGRIKRDRSYDARVIGWRIPAFSRYPNIVSIQEQPR